MLLSEKERNILTKNLKNQKNIIPSIFEFNNNPKNMYNTLTKRENYKNQIKNKPININTFITEINSFLLPNNKTFKTLKNLIKKII